MRKIKRKRGLRISAVPRCDSGSRPAHRARTVGANRKLYPRFAVGMPDGDTHGVAFDCQRRRRDRSQPKGCGARLQRRDEVTVLDIVAERIAIDFRGGEQNLRRAKKPRRIVDDAQFLQWCGLPCAALPGAQSVERRRRPDQQRRGAIIGSRRRRNDQRVDASGGKRDCTDQSSRPSADNRDLRGEGGIHADSATTELRIRTPIENARSQTTWMRSST